MHSYTELYPNAEVGNAVHEYCISNSTPVPTHLDQHRDATLAYCQQGGENERMMINTLQAQFLIFWAKAHGAKRVLEIGMFTGYSALAWAEALKDEPEGQVVCLDLANKSTDFARATFAKHGVDKVKIIEGSAHTSIDSLAGQQFDIVFIDADKAGYVAYFEKVLALRLLSPKGVIIADNALWHGLVADHSDRNPAAATKLHLDYKHVHRFNEVVKNDPRVEHVLLPAFDGLHFIRVRDVPN